MKIDYSKISQQIFFTMFLAVCTLAIICICKKASEIDNRSTQLQNEVILMHSQAASKDSTIINLTQANLMMKLDLIQNKVN